MPKNQAAAANLFMAQQKMLYVFQGTCRDIHDANGSDTLSSGRISKISESTVKKKDTESSSSICRNYSSWSTILASSTPGSNKYIFAVLPTQCLDHKSSSKYPQINMEELDMITTFPSGSLKFSEQMILGGPITDGDCSGESIVVSRHKRPQLLHLPSVKCFINDGTNWKVLPFSSLFSSPSINTEYPLVLSCGPDTTSSAYRYIKGVDDKAVQRNSKRKASRKRGKCNDLSRTSSSAELNSENGTSQTESDRIEGMCTIPVIMPYMKENIDRINQNVIASESGMQEFVECTFMVDTSENGSLDDGIGSMCSSALTHSELDKSLLPDSLSPASDGGETSRVHHFVNFLKEEDAGLGVLKLELCNDDKNLPSPEETLQGDVEPSNWTFRNKCVRQETDRDRTSSSLEKKECKARNLPRKSSFRRHSSLGNLNIHYGKENTHSIWKIVQRNVSDAQNYQNNKQSTKLVPSHHKHHSGPNACLLSKHEDANNSQIKEVKRTRRRKGIRSKQELHSTCKIESHAAKGCSCVSPMVDMKKTKLSSSRQNLAGCESRSFSRKNSSAIFQAKKVESIAYKPLQKPEDVMPVQLSQTPNSVDPVMVFHVTESQFDLPSRQFSFNDIPNNRKEDSFIDDNIRTVKDLSEIDYCKEKMCSTVSAEKCVSLGVKNLIGHNLGQSGLQLESHKLDDGSLHLEGIPGKKSFYSPHFLPYPVKVDQSLVTMSEDESSKTKLEMLGACTPKSSCNNKPTNRLTCKFKDPILFNSAGAMVNVFQAVHDSYRAQLASEAIQSITGSPIAEFEKFIYSASPVLYGSRDVNNCDECLPSHDFRAPLCEHETPNLALGNIWKWYEKHGACGMEVIAKDHEHSVRLGMDQFAFRAYFVPYLSAVQLFRKCKVHPNNDADVNSRETDSSECSSTSGLASVVRKLVPQACSVNSSTFSKTSQVSHDASFASMDCMIDNEQSGSKSTDGVELLFEYFEYDQPQQRRPLFETIKELSSGNIPVKSRLYGDPSSLETLGMNDLHPSSWYSVAWYPIYRIPDGKLRAAFLTYHSLGHLVRRSPNHDSRSVHVSIISPVVGLQCYSAQGECWFNPRQSAAHKKNNVMDADPSHVLKQRIRSLEQTASAMARATVTTGSKTHTNRQPDYEFFLSRSR